MDLLALVARLTLDKSEYEKGLNDAESDASSAGNHFQKAFSGVGKVVGTAAKAGAAAIGAGSAAVGVLTKQAVDGYSNYEQLSGGVKKLFGDASDAVMQNASEAYKTSGMNANQYMEQATSFSAALIKSLGGDTEKAAQQADVAMRAMSDNVNTFGTDMGSVQNAFQGFAKGNYTMLDNLKLGYGGTKEEMQKLIDHANELGKANGEAADLSIESFSDIVTAIQRIQEEQNIAGTTSKEAATTIEGSLNMTKSAWENLVAGFANPDADLGQLMDNLVVALVGDKEGEGLLNNIIPAVRRALEGIGQFVEKAAPIISKYLPELMNTILPPLITAATTLVAGLVQALPTILQILIDQAPTIMSTLAQAFLDVAPLLLDMVGQIFVMLVDAAGAGIETLWNAAMEAINPFIEDINGAFESIGKFLSDLWEGIKKTASEKWEAIKKTVTDTIEDAKKAISEKWDSIKTTVSTTIENIKKAVSEKWDAIKTTVGNAVDGIKTTVTNIWNSIKTAVGNIVDNIKTAVSEKWDAIKTTVSNTVEGIKTAASEKFESLKEAASEKWSSIKETVGNAVESLKEGASEKLESLKEKAGGIFDALKSDTDDKMSGAKTIVTDAFNAMVDAVGFTWELPDLDTDAISNAYETVSGAVNDMLDALGFDWSLPDIDTLSLDNAGNLVSGFISDIMDSFSNIRLSLPDIQLPHLSVSWEDLGPISIPHISVDWYAKAYANPYMFTSPTVVGAMGFGDGVGGEIVYGHDNLMRDIREASGNNDRIEALLQTLIDVVRDQNGKQIVLDTGKLVGELTPAVDSRLGVISARRGRYN